MAKVKGLINPYKMVSQIEQPGDEFEVHESLQWVDLDDKVKVGWIYDPDTKKATDPHIASAATPEGLYNAFLYKRLADYGEIGDQLDMLYKDLKNSTATWVDHITAAKAATAKVNKPDLPE